MPTGDPNEVPSALAVPDATVVSAGAHDTAAEGFGPPASVGEFGVLGHYRLVRELGRGGMGAVYAALDTRLGRRVALKTMLPKIAADADAKERFLREARAAGQISHENVVTVYDADEHNGVPYIAMQFLQGESLDEYLRRHGELSVPQAARIGAEAALGLSAAHELGLIHRDIKPANLWLEAPSGRVKVLDFGLAKPADTDRELTRSGMVVGTPAYMSPEQARGQKLDGRSDLFSLGVVLYRLLAGRLPFDGPTTMAVLTALAADDPPPLRALNPNVPEPLAAVVHQLLAKNPAARPQTAAEVVLRLKDAPGSGPAVEARPVPVAIAVSAAAHDNPFAGLDETEHAAATPTPARTAALRTDAGRGWVWALAAAGFAGAVVVGAVLALRPGDRGEPKPPPAAPEPVAKGKDPKPAPPPKPAAVDPDRKAAEWVVSVGGSVQVGDKDVKAAADLPKERFGLSAVNLNHKPVTDADLANLKHLYELANLRLNGTRVTDAGLAVVARLNGLTELWLEGLNVTGPNLAQLRALPRLKHVSLAFAPVADDALPHLAELKGLQTLGLGDTKVTGSGFAHLAKLPDLRNLWLQNLRLTDDALTHLAGCKALKLLVLTGADLTDAGLARLKSSAALEELHVRGTRVTDAGLADFRAAVPACRVTADPPKK